MSIFEPDWDASTEQRWDELEVGREPDEGSDDVSDGVELGDEL